MAMTNMIGARDLDLPHLEWRRPAMMIVPDMTVTDAGEFQAMKAKAVDEFERAYLSQILSVHQGNVSKAARAAPKERRAFQRLLQKHGLQRGTPSAA
jgi:DNA-binding NtrC family response regulator